MMDSVVEAAQKDGRDLDDKEMELVTRARDRIKALDEQMGPLEEAQRIAGESAERLATISRFQEQRRRDAPPDDVQYRSAGEYVLDRWRAGIGHGESLQRLDVYHRAAAHQTTTDNPGLLPAPIVGPIVSFIDTARPLVSALGPRQLPSGTWSRPNITQHTDVGPQSAEKAELISRKMVIGKIPVTAVTLGGYVNISRQNVDWTQPQIMDIVINDLAAQYALETEQHAAATFVAGATAGPTLPTGANDAAAIAGAFW